jgi:hypothetical protein
VDGSDIEAGIWVCGVGPRDPSANVQKAGGQAFLGSVPLESPGDVNRNRCEEEALRGGSPGGQDVREGGEEQSGQKQRTSSVFADPERRVQALRRPAGPQRFLHEGRRPHAVEAYRERAAPATRGDSLRGVVVRQIRLPLFCGLAVWISCSGQ